MPKKRRYSDDELRLAVERACGIADALRLLGVVPRGGNYETFRRRVRLLQLDTTHFNGKGWRKGSRTPVVPARSLAEILTVDSPYPTSKLKRRLLAAGLKSAACEVCEGTTWNGQPMPLELDHVNGCRSDNRIENLRILCPNCHAQTPTYRGRNIGRSERPRIPTGRGEPLKKASVWVRSPPGAPFPTPSSWTTATHEPEREK